MWRFLRRLFPTLRLARPRTTTKRGAVTESRTGLAVHFHFQGAPPRQAVAPKAPPKPRHEGRLWDTLLGKKPQPLTAASVRALPVERTAPPAPPPMPNTPFPGRQEWLRHQAEQADAAAIAVMQARHTQAAHATVPKRKPVRKKPVVVEAHTRNGKAVAQHTRKKPGTATAARKK